MGPGRGSQREKGTSISWRTDTAHAYIELHNDQHVTNMVQRSILLTALITGLSATAQDNSVVVRFSIGSTTLDATASAELEALCAYAKGRTLTITGHSDDQGADELNQRLSFERALEVRDHIARTCPQFQLRELIGQGGSQPIASNSTEEGRTRNRRVAVMIDPLLNDPPTKLFNPCEEHGHAKVVPLMPGADKPRELHQVNASSAIEARMSDGTIVRIPAGSIVDDNGMAIDGIVDLTYRSFMDPWDVVASGIPMHYGKGDAMGHFETAGMYEIYASKDGEQLGLRSGNEITLETQGPEVTAAYAGYALDATTGYWELAGRLIDPPAPPYTPASEAVRVYNTALRRLPGLPDSLTFQERQKSPDYCYTTRCVAARKPFTYNDGKFSSPYTAKQIPAAHLEMDKRYWKEHHRIAFTVNTSHRRHPEWRSFKPDKRWLYTGDLDRRAFRKTVSRKHYYQDLTLDANSASSHATLRLKDRGQWLELPIELADPADSATSDLDLERSLRYYDKRALDKGSKFDRDVSITLKQVHAQRARLYAQAYSKATKRMNAGERDMDKTEFDAHALTTMASNNSYQQQRDNTYQFSRRPRFAMPGFGIWNCDRMIPLPTIEIPVQVLAQNGVPLQWVKAFGVPAQGRAVVTYWNLDGKVQQHMRLSTSCERIIFIDADRNMTVAVIPDGKHRKESRLILNGTPLDQPQDRSVLATLAIRE